MLTRKQVINYLTENPVGFGQMLGFDKLTDLHNDWIKDMVYGREDETLEAHRNSYKTTCVSVALALIIIELPKLRTAFLRKTDSDVKEIIRQVTKILKNERTIYLTKCLYGIDLKLMRASATEISTNLDRDIKGTSQLVGMGTSGSMTGKHFDRIFTDDIINVQDRASTAERERTKLVYQELQNIKNRGGRIFNILTPWHKEDASILMPKPKIYDCYSTGLMTTEDIEAKRESMSPSLFAANYELKHIASEDVIFLNPKTGADASLVLYGLMHVDSAFDGADYTALSIAKEHDGKIYVLGKMWRKNVLDCYNQIDTFFKDYLCSKLYNETNADKGMVARDLKKKLGLKVVTYAETTNKYIKIVTYLKKCWKDIIFVNGTDQEYIDQICDYTDVAEHDDAPDSLASLMRVMYPKLGREENLAIYDL